MAEGLTLRIVSILSLALGALLPRIAEPAPAAAAKLANRPNRLIVLTDIGAEVDDTESMVRLLLYSDVIDIQGLVATTSTWKRTSVSPDLIGDVVRAYAKVHMNLLKHDPNYPAADSLEASIKRGWPAYGMTGVGAGKDSEGSEWIIQTLEKNDDRPLWVSIWGGANTLAQALYKLRATRPAAEVDRLISKLRVYSISDQDDSGPWIRKNFPKLFYIVSPGGDYSAATWAGINSIVPGLDNSTISNKWLAEHIQEGHGPLGAVYPDVAYGMEGDTPSWLALIPNGLNEPEHPDWGGWGGRYEFTRPRRISRIRTLLLEELPSYPKHVQSGPMRLTTTCLPLPANMGEERSGARNLSRATRRRSGDGEMTSRMTSRRGWIGRPSRTNKPTTLPRLSWTMPARSRCDRDMRLSSAPEEASIRMETA